MRSGCSSGSIYWVLLVSGRFCVSKTIIPEAEEHFLTSSTRRDTYLFGGLGFSLGMLYFSPVRSSNSDWRLNSIANVGCTAFVGQAP